MARRKSDSDPQANLPTREEILAFVAEHPGRAGKREIVRAFSIKGTDRTRLKQLLRQMQDDGSLNRSGKRLIRPGDLPPVTVLTIVGRDHDGELLAEPASWDVDEQGERPQVLIEPANQRKSAPTPGVGDRILARLGDKPGDHFADRSATIIKVLETIPRDVLGIFRKSGGKAWIEPVDRKQREMRIEPLPANDIADGDLVIVEPRRPTRAAQRTASIRSRIGSMHSEKAVAMIAIHTYQLPTRFSQAALDQAGAAQPAGTEGRQDWRALPLITIDPPDAKDHDDAVHAEPDPAADNPNGWILTIAIADVAHYIRPGSPLDREALQRGNSVYFPDHVIPMLPERISTDLCSLKEGVDRPAIALRITIDENGRLQDHRFDRIIMRSAARLSYQQAQAAIDGNPDGATADLLEGVLTPLWNAYSCLQKARRNRQPLDLDLPERKVLLNAAGMVEQVVTPPRLDAHRLIEEFMIAANVCAAQALEKAHTPLLYRIHDEPSPEKLDALREFLRTMSINLPKSGSLRPALFNRILDAVAGTQQAHLVNEVILRSQAQAEYSPANIGHFGLNLRRYAHFTSPIRRYADLVVHRALIRAFDMGSDGMPEGFDEKLETIGAEISAAERRAMAAERDTTDRLMAIWLADHVGAEFTGKVAGVINAGLFVELDETGADGFVPISTLGEDYFVFDPGTRSVAGEKTGLTYRLGDAIKVRLLEVAAYAGALRFEILSGGRIEKPRRRPHPGHRRRRGGKRH